MNTPKINFKKWEEIYQPKIMRPTKAYAVIDINKPKISVLNIFDSKDIILSEGEIIIEVLITPISNDNK